MTNRNFSKKRRLHGGDANCGSFSSTAPTATNPTCLPTPNVEMYKYPCPHLTENQFGMAVGGRSKKRRVSRRSQRGGSCAGPTPDCMGNNYDNLGKTAISDGGPNDMPTPSELSWFFRNTYGAIPSTNVVTQPVVNTTAQKGGRRKYQRGGNVFLDLNDKIGGLSRVGNTYDPYPPSFSNLEVTGKGPQDVQLTQVIPYNTRYNGATAQPELENSSLTRNSFELSGGGGSRKKKSFLTRKSRNHLFGGNGQYPNVFNGVQGEFSPDMSIRNFNCNQPNWSTKCT
jgi:hypothetical protein